MIHLDSYFGPRMRIVTRSEITSQGLTTLSFRAEVMTVGPGTTKRPTFLMAWQKAMSSPVRRFSL